MCHTYINVILRNHLQYYTKIVNFILQLQYSLTLARNWKKKVFFDDALEAKPAMSYFKKCTSTAESDFSVIGWEKDEYRTMLSDLSFEEILHSREKHEITSIKGLLNKLNN